jgi:transposase
MDNYRLPKADSARTTLATVIGQDGRALLAWIDDPTAPAFLRTIPAVQTLRQVWQEQYTEPPDLPVLRPVTTLPPSSQQIASPYDPEARYATKRSVDWVGYKVHLTETCDAGQPRLITHVETTVATVPDDQVVPAIHQALKRKALLPQIHLVDAGYTDADLLRDSTTRYGIDLVGPVAADASWQAREQTGFDHTAFQVDWDAQTVTCPQGSTSVQWHAKTDVSGVPVIDVRFARSACQPCPSRSQYQSSNRSPQPQNPHPGPLYRDAGSPPAPTESGV